MESTKSQVWIMIAKQLCISLLLGTAPTFILFYKEPTKSNFIHNVRNLIPDDELAWYFFAACVLSFLLSCILKYIWLQDTELNIAIFVRDVLKEIASAFRNIIQTIVGVILGFVFIWNKVEPQTFSIKQLVLFLIISLCYIYVSTMLEVSDHLFDRKIR